VSSDVRRGTRVGSGAIRFIFDGREYRGQPGDTAASALLAQGVRFFGRSVKYRRLRGVLAAGPEEPNALLTVGESPAINPNVSAPQLAIRDGLKLRSQNRWPTLTRDVTSLLQAGGGLFGAGFYYKTFMWPSWRAYETLIRRLAGSPGSARRRARASCRRSRSSIFLVTCWSPARARQALRRLARRPARVRASCCASASPPAAARSSSSAAASRARMRCRGRQRRSQNWRRAARGY
jgi:NADPH-dependent 2,4-dienoyl-CoA reductase/sulfur reductase-like enzyme